MSYPFEQLKSSAQDKANFERHLPHISQSIVEFFRAASIAQQSMQQKNMFGDPLGIRRDLGFEDALKLLMIACYNDGQIVATDTSLVQADLIRQLTLRWHSFGHNLDGALFIAHYLFTSQSQALYALRDLRGQVEFVSNVRPAALVPEAIAPLLAPLYSEKWYRSKKGVGDKLSNIFIAEGDYTKVDFPRPLFQVHFKKTQQFDLRAPLCIEPGWVEQPTVVDGKATVSCPGCGQKCRVPALDFLEIRCPKCKTLWQQGI